MLDNEQKNYTDEPIEDEAFEDVPEVDQELSQVATNPKQNIAIAIIIGLAFIYYLYVMFIQDTEEEKRKKAENNRPIPTNVTKPVQTAINSNIPSLPSLPAPPKLEDPTAPPLLIEDEATALPINDRTLPELPSNTEVLPTISLPNANQPVTTANNTNTENESLPAPPSPLSKISLDLPPKQSIVDPDEEKRRKAKLKSSIILISGVRPAKTPEQIAQEANFTKRGNLNYLLGRGKIINAVIESAINSDFGGEVRALINRDIYSEQGKNVLIPKGSRVFGNYSSSLSDGYGRINIVWTRVDLSSGYTLTLDGTGIDNLGRNGSQGRVDNKLKERLANAVLRSVLNIGIASALDKVTPIERAENVTLDDELRETQAAITAAAPILTRDITATFTSQDQAIQLCGVITSTLVTRTTNAFTSINTVCNSVLARGAAITQADVTAIQSALSAAQSLATTTSEDNNIVTRTETAATNSAEEIATTLQSFTEEQDHSPTITIDQGTVVKIYVNKDYTFPKAAIGVNARVVK